MAEIVACFIINSKVSQASSCSLRAIFSLRHDRKKAGGCPAVSHLNKGKNQPTMRYFTKPSGASPIFSILMPAGW